MANFVMADWHDVGANHILKAMRILLAANQRQGKGLIGRTVNAAARAGIEDRAAGMAILNLYLDSDGDTGTWAAQEIAKDQITSFLEAFEAEMQHKGQAGIDLQVRLKRKRDDEGKK